MKTALSNIGSEVAQAAQSLLERVIGPLSIRRRIAVLVLALLLPMNALVAASIVKLANLSGEAEYTHLRYTASVMASSLEARLARYLAVARALGASPALLEDDLSEFRRQAAAAFPDTSDAWPLIATPDGQEIMNLRVLPPLPRRSPQGFAAQTHAFEQGTPIVSGVYRGKSTGNWLATIEYPIFRDGKPYRSLTIGMSAEGFFRLLDAQRLPEGWIAGIADRDGRYVARSAGNVAKSGQPVSEGWKATLQRAGITKFPSLEGGRVVNANELSPLSGWTVGVAVLEKELDAPVWATLRWAIAAGIAVSLLSLAVAILVARRITKPILELERNAAALVSGQPVSRSGGLPEAERVWDALQTAVTERQRFEHDLRLSEELLRTASEGAGFGAHDYDAVARRMRWSPELGRLLGLDYAPRSGVTWETAASYIHPEDRGKAQAASIQIAKGMHRRYELEFRIVREDGEVRWILDRGQTIKDPKSGRTLRVIGVAIDITQRKSGELRQQILLKELSHRVKNTLAIVQSIAMQTLRTTKDPGKFGEVFSARLISLAKAHSLLTQRAWEGASLDAIVRQAIEPFLSNAGEFAFTIDGPATDIPANSTITLALMLHELLSNAARYGALSVPHGRVTIMWEITGSETGRQLTLHWKEEGGPPMAEPGRKGFGTRLLTMSAEQLAGHIAIDFAPSGLCCTLGFPLPRPQSASAASWSYSI